MSFCQKLLFHLLNTFMYMFNLSTLYIAPSKAVVGVDPPMKAISMQKKKGYKGKSV